MTNLSIKTIESGEFPADGVAAGFLIGTIRRMQEHFRALGWRYDVDRQTLVDLRLRDGGEPGGSREQRLVAALEMMYDKWENGVSCYEDADTTGACLGNAFRLNAEEEQEVLSLIPAEGTSYVSSPADLVGALQDVVHTDPGPVRAAKAHRSEPLLCIVVGCKKPCVVADDGAVGALCEEHNRNVGLRGYSMKSGGSQP